MTTEAAAALPVVELTPMEDALCEMLRDTCLWIAQHRPQPNQVESAGASVQYTDDWTCEARIAGGWVRDKLLGLASHDLDISLSSLTGHVFALLLRQYLLSPEFVRSSVATRADSPLRLEESTAQLISHVTKIDANPEQSKNLETATAEVAGLQLDFVNLRKEVYIGASRIPTMTFGTAREDAERRDITINALFYNLSDRQVEDWTGKGLDDIRRQHIRTPLEPRQTFIDDPLRVLRCVRFASRFGYTVDDEIFRCLQGADGREVRLALQTKVSRERFGMEVDKMMLGPDPSRAIAIIKRMAIFDIVFGPPPDQKIQVDADDKGDDDSGDRSTMPVDRAVAILDALQADGGVTTKLPFLFDAQGHFIVASPEKKRLLFYSAALLPLRRALWERKRKNWQWAGACVMVNGLKIGTHTGEAPMTCLWRSTKLLHMLLDPQSDPIGDPAYARLDNKYVSPRVLRALWLRSPAMHRPELHVTPEMRLLWAMMAHLSCDDALWPSLQEGEAIPLQRTARVLLSSPTAAQYASLYDRLKAEGVWERIDEKVLLNGTEVIAALNIKKGRAMKSLLTNVEAWQFDRDVDRDNVDEAKEQCKLWLAREWRAGQIVPFDEREE